MHGNIAANRLVGLAGDDRLFGHGGGDNLFGGTGDDRLAGGGGADRFFFDTALDPANNVDRILDFSGEDRILLDRAVFAGIEASGGLSADAFHVGTSAQDAEDRIVYDEASGRLFYDADGAGGAAAVLFARVDAGLDLAHGDFIAYI